MYVVLARKYRPRRFEDVVGQDHISRTLQNAIRSGRVAHAYLFCGSRGVGKTTVARILAKALNCEKGPTPEPCGECEACRRIATGDDMDVLEIDGASTRGIDQVRELRQNARLVPAHSRFKVYYIDEVHMLTDPAFNALLKTLEEPPPHVKFIFSTTDPQKLPETVKSRCQRFDFRRVADADIVRLLEEVCRREDLQIEPQAAAAVARAARGSIRDALGVLDQLAASGGKISVKDVLAVLGAVDPQALTRIVDALAREETAAALRELHALLFAGTDVEDLADQLSEYLRDLLVASCCGPEDPILAGSGADAETLKRQCALFSPDQFTYVIQLLREAKLRARRDTTGRIALELAVLKASRLSDLVPLQEALEDPGSAPPAGGKARTASAGAAQPPSGEAVGALRRMNERLRTGKGRPARTDGPGGEPPRPAQAKPPEGLDEVKHRQIAACATDPETARDGLSQPGLMDAFVQADRTLGLEPLRLERSATAPAAEGPAEADEPSAESHEEEQE
jgi:DNA polymerase-3 subunit gamma/tau